MKAHPQALTQASILAARQWFHDNHLACIREVLEGKVRVNDKESLIKERTARAAACLRGDYDHTLAFKQQAYYIQTGECIAILP